MSFLTAVKSNTNRVLGTLATAGTALVAMPAAAQSSAYVTSAQTGIEAAKDDALTVGGYVIAAVAVIIAISWILSMVKKR